MMRALSRSLPRGAADPAAGYPEHRRPVLQDQVPGENRERQGDQGQLRQAEALQDRE